MHILAPFFMRFLNTPKQYIKNAFESRAVLVLPMRHNKPTTKDYLYADSSKEKPVE